MKPVAMSVVLSSCRSSSGVMWPMIETCAPVAVSGLFRVITRERAVVPALAQDRAERVVLPT